MQIEIQTRDVDISSDLASSDCPALLQRIFAARGVQTSAQLERSLQALHPYTELKGIDAAVDLLASALEQGQKILIAGDYDADGATSSALAVSALKVMGAQHIEFLVPNRFEFGYGLSPELVDLAAQMEPDLLITVDNGISSVQGVQRAHEHGMKVLITDHHLPGETVPDADAIVNPNQAGDIFPSKNLAGVGVIFYVMLALRARLRDLNWFATQNIKPPNMADFLDLVALGTVADVVPLDQNNRILVHQGICRMRAGKIRPGIKALFEVANRRPERLVASDLGFAVGPRLNAAGRLEDMSIGVMCLLADQDAKARRLAQELDRLNVQRREIERTMQEQASKLLDRLQLSHALPTALSLYDASWHEGVIGILAGRIKERHYRPTAAFAKVSGSEEEGEAMLKGSVRSIPGLHIRDVLAEVDRLYPGVIAQFGGHAMAAGLSLPERCFDLFKEAFNQVVHQITMPAGLLQAQLLTDGVLDAGSLNLESARLISNAGPWGQQFPEPCFQGIFDVLEQRLVGERHLKLTLRPDGELRGMVDAILFNVDLKRWPNHHCRKVRVVYRLDENIYQERSRLQLMLEHIEAAG